MKQRENLKPSETHKFMKNAFRDGEIKTAEKTLSVLFPLSHILVLEKSVKTTVIDKQKTIFGKYFGIGVPATFTKS